ncbi:DUF1566 domain-containing protein [Sulfuricaulis sp.]|jgi:hypothetical protein|uniref:Lcl C-terminal domain-containing protein n=1 Tax=Sulfuricaulis sp. TaxID=2003553 RepID=UPI0035596E44
MSRKVFCPALWTGQETCHDAQGRVMDCAGSGQDAEGRRGRGWPAPRFEASGDTVQDLLTELMWTRDANPAEFPLSWQEALDFVAEFNRRTSFGFSDWRLPNRRELRSLISHQTRRPALPAGHPFVNVFAGWYWSSTTAAISPGHAWYVDIDGGRMFYGGKDQSFMLWPVRGTSTMLAVTGQRQCFDGLGREVECSGSGQDGEFRFGVAWPEPRFEPGGVATYDRLTGLYWRTDAELGGAVTWQEALDRVRALNLQSPAAPWRLPTITELESLTDCSMHSPALPRPHTFKNLRDVYWSSTTSLYEPDWAWALYLDKGAVGVGQKQQARFHVWAVCEEAPG